MSDIWRGSPLGFSFHHFFDGFHAYNINENVTTKWMKSLAFIVVACDFIEVQVLIVHLGT